ncbi:MAG TPA: LCP family protein [Euzebyales bacterium]|nr:LCP family protein [Euzebyales bacterium]
MSVQTDEPSTDMDVEYVAATRRRALVRVAVAIGAILALVVVGTGGLVVERQRAYDSNIERIPDVFPDEAGRPAAAPEPPAQAVAPAENWLLVGSDRRADQGTTGEEAEEPLWEYGAQRADTIMLVHLPADRRHVYLVSFPRDSWVPIDGHGEAKVNAALSFGGPPLLIATIEQMTGVRIDHYAALDFEGFESMTDALDGVDVRVAQTVSDPKRDTVWTEGSHHLGGEEALKFVRQRHNLPGGDFDRIKRQQAFLKALAGRAVDRDVLINPVRLNAFLEALTKAVSVDDTVAVSNLRSLVVQMRSVRPDDIAFMTVPTAGTGTEDGQSVVYIDPDGSRRLYRALRKDAVEKYVARFGDSVNQVDTVQ